jgi:DNA polymerase-3 subunit alpha
MDIPLPEVDRVAKLVPNIPGKPVSIQETLEAVPEFREITSSTPYLQELVETASKLEGVARNAGTHAAGVIITDRPMTEYIPLHRPTKGGPEDSPVGAVTQFEMQVLDSLGLLKVDFLGLSTLTVMQRACALIRERTGREMDIHTIPLDDEATYELLGRGDVLGVFQVEGAGMRRYLMEMKPRSLAHVTAMVALYRPGPMEFIPDYIRRMHGEAEVSYRHPDLVPILEETYGVTVYQEQIMYTAMRLARYTASEADNLRKSVAKKKAEALHNERAKFVSGAVENGVERKAAEAIFDDWESFARYGFPKGHAADYAVICVETAYLKAHYPAEYMTALLSVFKHDTDRVALYIADCRRLGIDVLPPDVNRSGFDFEIEARPGKGTGIRYGLGAIKNVGEGAVQAILVARRADGDFRSVDDFARRVDLRQVGKRALESLVRVGALDGLAKRIVLFDALDRILAVSAAHFRAKEIGQLTFFGGPAGASDTLSLPTPSSDVPRRQQLNWEKELLGVYVSDHPLTPHLEALTRAVTHFSAELRDAVQGQSVCVAGVVNAIRPYQTRTGKAMAFVSLEDVQGAIELVVFSRLWKDVVRWLQPEMIVVARGKVDGERGDPKVLVEAITSDLQSACAEEPGPAPAAGARAPAGGSPSEGPPGEAADEPPPAVAPEAPPLSEGMGWEAPVKVEDPVLTHAPVLGAAGGEPEVAGSSWEPPLAPAPAGAGRSTSRDPLMITLVMQSTGDGKRDARRMRRVYGILTSYPGKDRFAFHVYESARRYHLEFPNSTTGYCTDLQSQLERLLGEGKVRVERLPIH